jgi:hypothetical protein
MEHRTRFALAIAAGLAASAACGGGGDDMADDTGDDAPAANSAAAVREVAAAIYDEVDAGDVERVADYMEAAMLAMGVPAETEPAALDARVAAHLPAFMKPQTHDLAVAYANENYVELDNLIAALAERGLHTSSGVPLDRAFFDARFGALVGRPAFATDEALPALVLALGAERATRYAAIGPVDPIWGDGLLDPLQTTLVLYAIGAEVSGVDAPAPPSARLRDGIAAIFDFTLDRLQGRAETRVMDEIQWPLGADDLAQASPCVSLALYGHKLTMANTPDHIYHQQVDVPMPPAFMTTITMSLEFLDDYWNNYIQTKGWVYNALVGAAGCMLPRQGPARGKPLVWWTGPGLEGHGLYDYKQPNTDTDGEAMALWGTVAETTPIVHRTAANREVAFDWTYVRAGMLVPGWNNLALVAGGLKKTPDTGEAYLAVLYYKTPCASGLSAAPGPGQCLDEWHGSASAQFDGDDGPSNRVTATGLIWRPLVTNTTETIYQVEAGAVTYEMWDSRCTYSFAPSMMTWGDPAATSSGDLDYRFGETPVTYSGQAGMFWSSQMTVTCPDGSSTIPSPIGGVFFRADAGTPPSGEVLAGNYTIEGFHFVYSFHR